MSGILYSCVALQSRLLVDHTTRSGNFKEIVVRLLASLGDADLKTSYIFQGYYFHFKVSNHVTYMCLSDENFTRRLAFLFLDKISELFEVIQYNDEKVRLFDSVLKYHMKKFSDSKVIIPKTQAIQDELDEVKGIMVKNIEGLMKRGEQLELLEDTTIELEKEAETHKNMATKVKGEVKFWHRMRIILLLAIGCIVLTTVILIIVYFVCNGFKCGVKPTDSPTFQPTPTPTSIPPTASRPPTA